MAPRRFPPWIRTRLSATESLGKIHSETYGKGLHTVCREALCPNQGECARQGTATFMILGDRCTRNCSFCAVGHGQLEAIQVDEPSRVAESVKSLGLGHAVITSVTRDDLDDGGASVFAETVRAIRKMSPLCTIEVLIPDFQGRRLALTKIIDSAPDVINHNLETVSRLYARLRRGASYERSLTLLRRVKDQGPEIVTKSGIMVGLGETGDELQNLFVDLGSVGCEVLTIGQYLQPTPSHHPIIKFVTPREFEELHDMALAGGLKKVAAGPLVRSSYKAAEVLQELRGMESTT